MTNTKAAKPKLQLELQIATQNANLPSRKQLRQWVLAALQNRVTATELVIRIVDSAESATLNQQYRRKAGSTNVLSFPADLPATVKSHWLGDLVICAPQVTQEAEAAQKPLEAHWAHLVIHGVLHLLGYDHIKEKDAAVMEALETRLLHELGYPDPYQPR